MKKIYSTGILFLIFIINGFSQCDNFSISLNAKDIKKLYYFSENTEITVHVSFNKSIYKKAYVEIYQVIGPRPVNFKKFEIKDSSALVMPVWYISDAENQFLLIKISESQNISTQSFDSGNQCIDTIKILEGAVEKNKDAFWHKDINMSYTVSLDNKRISNSFVTFENKNLKVTENSIVFIGNGLNTNCKITDQGKQYEFWIRAEVKSNEEVMDIIIFPDAMKNIMSITGIKYSNQIKDISNQDQKKILDKFPEYEKILNKNVKFASTKMYKTDHIVIYILSDQSGIHFTGADCVE